MLSELVTGSWAVRGQRAQPQAALARGSLPTPSCGALTHCPLLKLPVPHPEMGPSTPKRPVQGKDRGQGARWAWVRSQPSKSPAAWPRAVEPCLLRVPICGMAVTHGVGGHTEPHRAAPKPSVKRPHTRLDTGAERGTTARHTAGRRSCRNGRRHVMEAWERLEGFRKAATAGL